MIEKSDKEQERIAKEALRRFAESMNQGCVETWRRITMAFAMVAQVGELEALEDRDRLVRALCMLLDQPDPDFDWRKGFLEVQLILDRVLLVGADGKPVPPVEIQGLDRVFQEKPKSG